MMTRRATHKDMEEKLRAALKELKSSRAMCTQLLQEREDSEVEVKNIVDKNTYLKNELAELHIQHMDLADQHNQLLHKMAAFQECADTHEQSLKRIIDLEHELCEAHNIISHSESVKVSEQGANTSSLYEELVGSQPNFVCEPAITIDLTGDDTIPFSPIVMSHNKLKKYIKIKKFIKRSQRAIKKQNLLKQNLNLRKERIMLSTSLSNCTAELDKCKIMYDVDTQCLLNDLLNKEKLLKDIFAKYEICQQQLSDRLLEAAELMDLLKCNAERYESLTNNLSCTCTDCPPPAESQLDNISLQEVPTRTSQKNEILFFSDELGSGFGKILHNYLSHSYINHSYHKTSFNHIVSRICGTKLDSQSTIVLLLGNSSEITKKDIVDGINSLLKLNIGKLMLCAFPYCENLSEHQNKKIYKLNNTMYSLTCCHSDKLIFFDTNKFISGFKLTQKGLYLSQHFRYKIAMLIAYNINEVIDNITKFRVRDEPMLSSYTNNIVIDCSKFTCCTMESPQTTRTSIEATTSRMQVTHLGEPNLGEYTSTLVEGTPELYLN